MIGVDIGATEGRGHARRASVRRMLVERRRELLIEIQSRVRVVRTVGSSVDCCEVIAPVRLRAMPFAVRCRECGEAREDEQRRERIHLQQLPSALGSRY